MGKINKHNKQDKSDLSENPIQSLISEQPGHQKHSGYLQHVKIVIGMFYHITYALYYGTNIMF